MIILKDFTPFDVCAGLTNNFYQRMTFCLISIFSLKLIVEICVEFQLVICSTNWHNICLDILDLDKAKPRAIVGRKATGPSFLG